METIDTKGGLLRQHQKRGHLFAESIKTVFSGCCLITRKL